MAGEDHDAGLMIVGKRRHRERFLEPCGQAVAFGPAICLEELGRRMASARVFVPLVGSRRIQAYSRAGPASMGRWCGGCEPQRRRDRAIPPAAEFSRPMVPFLGTKQPEQALCRESYLRHLRVMFGPYVGMTPLTCFSAARGRRSTTSAWFGQLIEMATESDARMRDPCLQRAVYRSTGAAARRCLRVRGRIVFARAALGWQSKRLLTKFWPAIFLSSVSAANAPSFFWQWVLTGWRSIFVALTYALGAGSKVSGKNACSQLRRQVFAGLMPETIIRALPVLELHGCWRPILIAT